MERRGREGQPGRRERCLVGALREVDEQESEQGMWQVQLVRWPAWPLHERMHEGLRRWRVEAVLE
jgi:hypothetical protein